MRNIIFSFFCNLRLFLKNHEALTIINRYFRTARIKLFPGRLVVFCCELTELSDDKIPYMKNTEVKNFSNIELLPKSFLKDMLEERGPTFEAQANRRFRNGATLWLIEFNKYIAGQLWTINREFTKPYFWPVMDKDIMIIDVFVFEAYRGKGLAAFATERILHEEKRRGAIRALIQTRTSNTQELRSLKKTSFKRVGICSRSYTKSKNKVVWHEMVGQIPRSH